MPRIALLITCFLLSAIAGPLAWAEELKIGYIDTEKLLKDAPQSESARKKLKAEFNLRDEKIVAMQKELKTLSDSQSRNTVTLSSAESIKAERQSLSLKRDIKRAKEEFNEDFNIRRNEELAQLYKLIKKMAITVGKELKYDIILSDDVLYNSKRVDITDIVLKRLEKLNVTTSAETGSGP